MDIKIFNKSNIFISSSTKVNEIGINFTKEGQSYSENCGSLAVIKQVPVPKVILSKFKGVVVNGSYLQTRKYNITMAVL